MKHVEHERGQEDFHKCTIVQVATPFNAKAASEEGRLHRDTSAFSSRKEVLQMDGLTARDSGFIRHVQAKSIPAWRQGL